MASRLIIGVALAISCLGLVNSACSQPGLTQTSVAQDAAGESKETLPPLVDLGPGQTYHGEEGGLHPGGSNVRFAAHDAAGRKIARDIVHLDAGVGATINLILGDPTSPVGFLSALGTMSLCITQQLR